MAVRDGTLGALHIGGVEAMSEVYLVSLIMGHGDGDVWYSVEGLHNYRSFLANLAQLLDPQFFWCTEGLLGLNVTAVCWYARAEEFVGMSKMCCVLPNLFHPASST